MVRHIVFYGGAFITTFHTEGLVTSTVHCSIARLFDPADIIDDPISSVVAEPEFTQLVLGIVQKLAVQESNQVISLEGSSSPTVLAYLDHLLVEMDRDENNEGWVPEVAVCCLDLQAAGIGASRRTRLALDWQASTSNDVCPYMRFTISEGLMFTDFCPARTEAHHQLQLACSACRDHLEQRRKRQRHAGPEPLVAKSDIQTSPESDRPATKDEQPELTAGLESEESRPIPEAESHPSSSSEDALRGPRPPSSPPSLNAIQAQAAGPGPRWMRREEFLQDNERCRAFIETYRLSDQAASELRRLLSRNPAGFTRAMTVFSTSEPSAVSDPNKWVLAATRLYLKEY